MLLHSHNMMIEARAFRSHNFQPFIFRLVIKQQASHGKSSKQHQSQENGAQVDNGVQVKTMSMGSAPPPPPAKRKDSLKPTLVTTKLLPKKQQLVASGAVGLPFCKLLWTFF
jgi:hypothetical protein